MTSVINRQQLNRENCTILYDASLISTPESKIFTPDYWQGKGALRAVSKGRGAAWFIEQEGDCRVLRHYRRGGLVARFNRDIYLGWLAGATRSLAEWDLLCWMFAQQLPVPRPVAAQACWKSPRLLGLYQAAIIVQAIPGSQNLSDYLMGQKLDASGWQAIGKTIACFHQKGIDHSDLNASNLLLDKQHNIYVIDFDKCQRRTAGDWQQHNIQRLKRSLDKFRQQSDGFAFSEDNWNSLVNAYKKNLSL